MELHLHKGTRTTFEAELVDAPGDFLGGTLEFNFKGQFPVDPQPFMPPPPPPPPPDDGLFYCYTVPFPKATVGVHYGPNYFHCQVESVTSDGFKLIPRSGFNLKALDRFGSLAGK